MKISQDTTPSEVRTLPSQVAQWAHALTQLHARIAPRFARPEPRRRAVLQNDRTGGELSGGSLSHVRDGPWTYPNFPRTLSSPRLDRGSTAPTSSGHPAMLDFQTKPELARRMLERVWDAQIPICWVVADTVYGDHLDLRTWLQAQGYAYVLAVPCNEPVGILEASGRRRQVQVRDVPALLLNPQDWQRLAISQGTKGPRLFDWAYVPILHRWQEDGRHWLRLASECERSARPLVLRASSAHLQPRCTRWCRQMAARWHIEEDFANAKDMGLDHYEVRSWIGWYRHIALVMLAHAFLTGVCVQTTSSARPPTQASQTLVPCWESNPLLPLMVPEGCRLLGHLIWPSPCTVTLVLAWSWWRRCHRSVACYYHTKRRREKG